jgi:DNA-binding PadR family transcriptional regulator
MKQLVSHDLLEEHNDESGDRRTKTTYRVTEKGEKFLGYLGYAIKSVKLEVKLEGK